MRLMRRDIGTLRRVAALALAGALAFASKSEACTSFLLKAADGSPRRVAGLLTRCGRRMSDSGRSSPEISVGVTIMPTPP
jgi:hypothetical protein